MLGNGENKAAGTEQAGRPALGNNPRSEEIEVVLGPRNGHIKKASLFFDITLVDRFLEWEESVGHTDDEDDGEFEPLGLVDGGHPDGLILHLNGAVAGLRTHKGKLDEKVFQSLKPTGKTGDTLQVIKTLLPIVVAFSQPVSIPAIDKDLEDRVGCGLFADGEVCLEEGGGQAAPFFDDELWDFGHALRIDEGLSGSKFFLPGDFEEVAVDLFCSFGPDFREEGHKAEEGGAVLWVGEETQLGSQIFNMGGLKKPEATGDMEGDASAGELHLEIHGMVVSTVEDGDIRRLETIINQFVDASGDKVSLGKGIGCGDVGGRHTGLPDGTELLLEDMGVALGKEHLIGKVEDVGG